MFAGVAPTGKQVSFTAIHIVRFANGKIVEWWGVADVLGVIQQLRGSAGPGNTAP